MSMESLHFEEILEGLAKLKGWGEFNQDFISKTFIFPDFKDALNFVNKIGVVADAQNHHPKIILTFGRVVVELSTHDAEGITSKDFDLAKIIDELFEGNK